MVHTVFPRCWADLQCLKPNISPATETSFHTPGFNSLPQCPLGCHNNTPFGVRASEYFLPFDNCGAFS